MPGRDGTGPCGEGSGSGGGRGPCGGVRRRFRWGARRGGGFGFGFGPKLTKDEELAMLKEDQAEIEKRISALNKK